ncbi:hypothetical protein LCGC14_2554980 [marine sediment metagenome]|uniref:5'-3' exonuclease alpha-helical arch N-terminal domain-containing protein n=1 Tax=marine sediment metagenome TaxID=412755 RepID=A0A0F9CXX5_9ZZZZ
MKYIWLDWGYYLHASIYAWKNRKHIPATYTATTMILGDLRKIGVDEDDIIIIAVDKGHSWRKEVDKEYKSTRKAKREAQKEIPWKKMFESFNSLLDIFEAYTPFHIVALNNLEADDIISYGVRYFKDKDNIICSVDGDFEQLFALPNVKIFSPHSKRKCYKQPPKNPYKIIEKKIKKEVSDDLVSKVETEADYQRRFLIINLLKLPEDIEKRVEKQINFLPKKDWEIVKLPFPSIHQRFRDIYKKDKVVTFEQSMKKLERKKRRKKC